ncbi:MAG: anti-sigma factor ChrR (cupin superfamily) [Oceanicoccus sp.]|jgi:anti-sigma factor ChrR (cupin superfamily)
MLNMDFTQRIVIDTRQQDWQLSPMAGVCRKPLAREDAERGHATSIVRYDAGARFSSHPHPLGEEILVLEGVFSDDAGDYPAGTYFRNPEGYSHAPFSKQGCIILVKLHQFQADDSAHIVIDTQRAQWTNDGSLRHLELHQFNNEKVELVHCSAGAKWQDGDTSLGEEIYVLSGELIDQAGRYSAGCWLRNPANSSHQRHCEQDTLIWLKRGHLS